MILCEYSAPDDFTCFKEIGAKKHLQQQIIKQTLKIVFGIQKVYSKIIGKRRNNNGYPY